MLPMHGAYISSFTVCTRDTRTYHRACILLFTVHTRDACTYHGHCTLSFTVRTRVMLVHTIAYCLCGARSGSPQLCRVMIDKFSPTVTHYDKLHKRQCLHFLTSSTASTLKNKVVANDSYTFMREFSSNSWSKQNCSFGHKTSPITPQLLPQLPKNLRTPS